MRILGGRRTSAAIVLVLAATGGATAAAVASSGAAAAAHHRRARHRVCRTLTLPRGGRVHHRRAKRRRRRTRVCVTSLPMRAGRLVVRRRRGPFTPPPSGPAVSDHGGLPRLRVGPYRPLGHAPNRHGITGVVGTSGTNAPPPSGPLNVDIASTGVIPTSQMPSRDTAAAGEPSVADAGKVVMYAFNWDAGYSTDGGRTFTELDPHTLFPKPAVGRFGCDQVVQYDPMTKMFIWVMQYQCERAAPNVERIAWASASSIAQHGAGAWSSFFDLDPTSIIGRNTYFDQPRLGFTPTFLYISMNQGALHPTGPGTFTDEGLQHSVILRIPRTAFTGHTHSLPFGSAELDPVSLRIAQNVQGAREFFVGHNGTSQLKIAWVDDSSNQVQTQVLNAPTIATRDWTATTPGGGEMLGRQQSSQGTQVTGVTQAGDGSVWAAWSEGRTLPNGTKAYPQPHIAVAVLQPIPGHATFFLQTQHEFVDPAFAYAAPDLATDARGNVAYDVVWGGGRLYYANHAVGILYPRDHRSGAFSPVADQLSSADPVDAGNPFGDYETVRPIAPPYAGCMAAAGIVNRTDSTGQKVGLPVFTVFSEPGQKCPPHFRTLPVSGLPSAGNAPPPAPTTLTLTCPGTGTVGAPIALSGAIAPPLGLRLLTVSVTGADTTSFQVYTHVDGTWLYTGYVPTQPGQYTFTADYPGESGHLSSISAPCTVSVSAPSSPPATAITLNCPASVSQGTSFSVTGMLSRRGDGPIAGAPISITYTSSTGGAPATHSVTTTSTGAFSDPKGPGEPPGSVTIDARYAGTATDQASTATCTVPVIAQIP